MVVNGYLIGVLNLERMQTNIQRQLSFINHITNLIPSRIISDLDLTQQIVLANEHGDSWATVACAEILCNAYFVHSVVIEQLLQFDVDLDWIQNGLQGCIILDLDNSGKLSHDVEVEDILMFLLTDRQHLQNAFLLQQSVDIILVLLVLEGPQDIVEVAHDQRWLLLF